MADEIKHGPLLRYLIAAAAAITAAYLGSLIGAAGTLIGTGAGAAISGAAAELYGHLAGQAKRHAWGRRTPKLAARLAIGGCVFAAGAYGALWAVETASGKPLHAMTTGAQQRGSSFTGWTPYTPPPQPAYTPAVATSTPAPSPPSQVPSASPDASATPTATPYTPSPSPSPTATASPSPVPSPSPLPPDDQPPTPYPAQDFTP